MTVSCYIILKIIVYHSFNYYIVKTCLIILLPVDESTVDESFSGTSQSTIYYSKL